MNPQQKNLFSTDPPPWELDAAAERLVARVVFCEAPYGPFDYLVPDELRGQVEPGRRLCVPLGRGNRTLIGYCVQVGEESAAPDGSGRRRLKPVQEVVDSFALLSDSMLQLTRWMAHYYLSPWGQVLEAVLPAGVRSQAGTREVAFLSVAAGAAGDWEQRKLPPKQAEAMRILAASAQPLTPQQLAASAGCRLGPIHALRQKGLVSAELRRVQHVELAEPPTPPEGDWQLNAQQQLALDAVLATLDSGGHQTLLIHGITGSGKTEVYIRAIQQVIRMGRQAIVLVPEISLTPQTRQRFRSRFDRVAVLHSHLSDSERHWHWQRIARGEVQVVVGARSAVFAPTPRLGLIVLDEEHDGSFKQDSPPRYHARDVAVQRATLENAPLVLGSATPSLESWHAARSGRYRLLELPQRVLDRQLPDVATLDLRTEYHNRRNRGAVSRPLYQAIRQALNDGGQVILLLNRRGFSTSIQCPACGHVVPCPNCDIALTHHREGDKALCHYCDYQILTPSACPECQFEGIRYSGLGTQRLEAEIRARFSGVSCLRMDSDAMQKPGSHEQALDQFRRGEVQILLGTQMIAKGLDFPNVTLVGVINADTALHFPDFRAGERTFQLVTQVAGRTARGEKGGRVLVQTFTPEHPAIQAAVRHDYMLFAEQELATRQRYGYPPLGSMIRLIVRGPTEEAVESFAEQLGERLQQVLDQGQLEARLLGPAPAPLAKVRGKFRYHLLVQAPDGQRLRQAVQQTTEGLKPPDQVQWAVDVDPLDML